LNSKRGTGVLVYTQPEFIMGDIMYELENKNNILNEDYSLSIIHCLTVVKKRRYFQVCKGKCHSGSWSAFESQGVSVTKTSEVQSAG